MATEMPAFPFKSSRHKNDSDLMNERTTPLYGIMGIVTITNYNDSDDFLSLFFMAVRPSPSNLVLQ